MTKTTVVPFPNGFGVADPAAMSLAALAIESGFMLGRVAAFLHQRDAISIEEARAAHDRSFKLMTELAKRAESSV